MSSRRNNERIRAKKTKKVLGRGLGSLLGAEVVPASEPTAKTALGSPHPAVSGPEAVRASAKPLDVEGGPSIAQSILSVGIEKLQKKSDQPRKHFDPEGLKELSASIKQHGILQPVVVRAVAEGRYEIIAGERRWRAAALAGMKQVPVIVKECDNKSSLQMALIENVQRVDLNPVEEALAYQHIMNVCQVGQQELADMVGKARATVANALRLLKLSYGLRQALVDGRLSVGHAKLLLSVQSEDVRERIGRQVVRESLSVQECSRLVKNALKPEAQKVFESTERGEYTRIQERLAQEIQNNVGTKVKVKYTKGKSQVLFYFYSDEQLNGFVENVRKFCKEPQ